MALNNSAQRHLIVSVCDQADVTALGRLDVSDWATVITLIHSPALDVDAALLKGAKRIASPLIDRHGFIAGLCSDAQVPNADQALRSTRVVVRARHCPDASQLADMEAALERSARQAVIVAGGHCIAVDSQTDGWGFLRTRIATSGTADALANDTIVHFPGAEIVMFDANRGAFWPSDVDRCPVTLTPPQLAIGTLLALRNIALINYQRAKPLGFEMQSFGTLIAENYRGKGALSRINAFLYQKDFWGIEQTRTRCAASGCANADATLLEQAQNGVALSDIEALEPVLAYNTAIQGARLNHLMEMDGQRDRLMTEQRQRYGSIVGDRFSTEKTEADFDAVAPLPASRDKVIFSVATYHKRVAELQVTIDSIYDQADEIHVYLNDLEEVPDYCQRDKIIVYRGQDFANLSAAGKMFFLTQPHQGYVFIIDDDNVLPPDYVEKMVRLIEFYKRRAAVTVHGSNMVDGAGWYYTRYGVYPYQRPQPLDKFVNLPGSGTFAYHTDTLKLDFAMFQPYVMVDLAVGIACRDQKVPIVCARRPEKWLQLQDSAAGQGLWEDFVDKPTIHTPAMIENGPWDLAHFTDYIMPMVNDVFGAMDEEAMVRHGLDADFIIAHRNETLPHGWSPVHHIFRNTATRERRRTVRQLRQCIDHSRAMFDVESRMERYDALLTDAYSQVDLSCISGSLAQWATDQIRRQGVAVFHEGASREHGDFEIGVAFRNFVYKPAPRSLKAFVKALWQNS